jgi:putative N6-adenine-specific DNA methylase
MQSSPSTTAFASTHPGLEAVLVGELRDLGVEGRPVEPGGVEFPATVETIVRTNLSLRTASRIILRIGSFHASSFHELERHAKKLPWDRFLAPGCRVHFRVTTKKSKLYHERAIVERLGAAIEAHRSGVEVVVGRGEADEEEGSPLAPSAIQRFVVRLHLDECTVSADTSGPLLHRRGYRAEAGKAPLRETLAAGCLLAAGWDGTSQLVDPMCGSGTIPIEAAMLARRIPPGWFRRFAFERWPEIDVDLVRVVRAHLEERILGAAPAAIAGYDRDEGGIATATANAAKAGVGSDIIWRRSTISGLTLSGPPGMIVTNPPYGIRIGERKPLRNLYAQLGNVLRRQGSGWRVTMISADRMLEGQTGLIWSELARTENGGIRIRLVTTEVPPG